MPSTKLTPRQLRVLQAVADSDGSVVRAVKALMSTAGSVNSCLEVIRQKLGVPTTKEAIEKARAEGILK